jgi:hypothetical protein
MNRRSLIGKLLVGLGMLAVPTFVKSSENTELFTYATKTKNGWIEAKLPRGRYKFAFEEIDGNDVIKIELIPNSYVDNQF